MIFALFPYPRRLRADGGVPAGSTQRPGCAGWCGTAALLGSCRRASGSWRRCSRRSRSDDASRGCRRASPRWRESAAAVGAGARAACSASSSPGVNEATVRVLAAEGCEVIVPARPGLLRRAVDARRPRGRVAGASRGDLIDAFSSGRAVDAMVVNAAGCGSHLKEYGRLFRDDPAGERARRSRRRSATSTSSSRRWRRARRARPLPLRDRLCTTPATWRTRSGSRRQPRGAACGRFPGSTLVEVPDGEQCCGSAGIYNLVQPESAERDRASARWTNVLSHARRNCWPARTRAARCRSRRSCGERGRHLPAAHPIEILDASISGTPLPS